MRISTVRPRASRLRLCRGAAATIALGALALMLAGCSETPAPAKPVDIAKDDACTRCKQPIVEIQYAAEFITKDGFVRKFDDMGCMLEHARKVTPKRIAAFFAVDYDTKAWMPADEAFYVRSERFKTPNNGGILAFARQERAEALAKQYEAELLKFADLLGSPAPAK